MGRVESSQTNASVCRQNCKNGLDRTLHHYLITTEKTTPSHKFNKKRIHKTVSTKSNQVNRIQKKTKHKIDWRQQKYLKYWNCVSASCASGMETRDHRFTFIGLWIREGRLRVWHSHKGLMGRLGRKLKMGRFSYLGLLFPEPPYSIFMHLHKF